MSDREREEAEQRLLEVLLVEEFDGTGVALDASGDPGTAARPRAGFWLVAAALLLGLGVVTATLLAKREGTPRRVTVQDPAGQEPVPVPDVATFERLLTAATSLRVRRVDTVGAYRQIDEGGAADTLEVVAWPEVVDVEGEQLGRWRQALRATCAGQEASDELGELYQLEFALGDGRTMRRPLSLDGDAVRLWVTDEACFAPDPALRTLVDEAIADIRARHGRNTGRVTVEQDLAQLPDDGKRVDVPAAFVSRLAALPCAATVVRLTARGQLGQDEWASITRLEALRELDLRGHAFSESDFDALARLANLRSLTLRECTGLDAGVLPRFTQLRRLERLHVVDVDGFAVALLRSGVVDSLPSLRDLGLCLEPGGDTRALLEPLARTKLQRLVLAGVPGELDLRALADLPSLRELVLVGHVADRDLRPLERSSSLRTLVLRNDSVSEEAMADLRQRLPELRVDWRLRGRWFDDAIAFEYEPRAR